MTTLLLLVVMVVIDIVGVLRGASHLHLQRFRSTPHPLLPCRWRPALAFVRAL